MALTNMTGKQFRIAAKSDLSVVELAAEPTSRAWNDYEYWPALIARLDPLRTWTEGFVDEVTSTFYTRAEAITQFNSDSDWELVVKPRATGAELTLDLHDTTYRATF